MQTNTDNGILAEAADLVAQWRRAASRCFDGDPDLAGRLSLRRERLFDDLRTRLASAEGLTERCSLISAMFAVTLDATGSAPAAPSPNPSSPLPSAPPSWMPPPPPMIRGPRLSAVWLRIWSGRSESFLSGW